MLSLTHILLLVLIVVVVSSPSRVPKAARALGEAWRNLRKGIRGEGDIDVTDSVKRLDE